MSLKDDSCDGVLSSFRSSHRHTCARVLSLLTIITKTFTHDNVFLNIFMIAKLLSHLSRVRLGATP